MDAKATLQRIYQLETELFQLERSLSQTELKRRQALHDQRSCQEALASYETLSLKRLIDRLKGNQEQQLEQFRQEQQAANAAVLHTSQKLDQLQHHRKELQQERQALPDREAIPDWLNQDPERLREYHRLEFALCKTKLLPLLQQTQEGLLEAQQVYRGDTTGQLMTQAEKQQKLSAPDEPSQSCAKLLAQMKLHAEQLQIPFEIPPYFQNPLGFLAAATRYTRHDRYNKALTQTASLLRKLENES